MLESPPLPPCAPSLQCATNRRRLAAVNAAGRPTGEFVRTGSDD